jgi:hypothetical protein
MVLYPVVTTKWLTNYKLMQVSKIKPDRYSMLVIQFSLFYSFCLVFYTGDYFHVTQLLSFVDEYKLFYISFCNFPARFH